MTTRYEKQIIMKEIGEQGQALLYKSHVLVIGAGGLGCPVLSYLAGSGIGTITIIDPDHVEISNLHRQVLYSMDDIGASKAKIAQKKLTALNPDITIHAVQKSFDPDNGHAFIDQADCVIDAADRFAVSYIASDLCMALKKPLISASVVGLSGYVGGFCSDAPSYRAVFPTMAENSANCSEAGVIGPLCGILGSYQAQMALNLLFNTINHDIHSPLGTMITINAQSWRHGQFSFHGAKEPDPQRYRFIASSNISDEMQVIELRDYDEAPRSVIPTASRLNLVALQECVNHENGFAKTGLQKDQPIILCCKTGLRSWKAARLLYRKGYETVYLHAAG
jgi:molybdopterin/thiamine biosynthesis adenylyltransferase/rhodanese-related sulfurtransferase